MHDDYRNRIVSHFKESNKIFITTWIKLRKIILGDLMFAISIPCLFWTFSEIWIGTIDVATRSRKSFPAQHVRVNWNTKLGFKFFFDYFIGVMDVGHNCTTMIADWFLLSKKRLKSCLTIWFNFDRSISSNQGQSSGKGVNIHFITYYYLLQRDISAKNRNYCSINRRYYLCGPVRFVLDRLGLEKTVKDWQQRGERGYIFS